MAILPTDVKLYESQRLTDEDDGGGLATGNVVEDGQVNNLFPDISRLDRTIGDVALRKCFVGIDTANSDVYLGAHTIITKRPADPLVSALLFETDNPNDERAAAQSQIESYVVRGARSNWFLLGSQYIGQRIIIGFQDATQDPPEVSEVFELWDPTESFNQFVRITTVETEIETFSYQTGSNFIYLEKRKLTLGISSPLENTYIGGTPSPGGTTGPASTVNSTEVADAAKYYGVSSLAVVGAPGDLIVEVDTIYSHLVPSAQSESVFADQIGAFQRGLFEPATDGATANLSQTVNYIDSALIGYTMRPIMPGSAVVIAGSSVYLDNAQGIGSHSSGSDLYNVKIDYALGIVTATRKSGSISGNGTIGVTYQPAAPLVGQAETGNIDVTLQNRAFNWTLNLAESKPRPGTLVVSYMALGKWQTIVDLGDGELGGEGSGLVNFSTGTVIVTMPVMPDAGTAIVFSYIANVDGEFEMIAGPVAQRPKHELQLEPGVKPGAVTLTWTSGTVKTATDDGMGVISGDADGFIAYATGEIIIEPVTVIDNNTNITVDYEFFTPSLEAFGSTPDQQGVSDFTILGAPVLPGSVTLRYNVNQRQKLIRSSNPSEISWADTATVEIVLVDDGLGGWLDAQGNAVSGSITYATGVCAVTTENDVAIPAIVGQITSGFVNRSYRTKSVFGYEYIRQSIQGAINCYYQPDTIDHGPQQLIEPITEMTLDLVSEPNGIAPGSLWFTFAGQAYTDNGGIIELNKAYATGAGTAVGTIDYATGEVILTNWPNGAVASVEIATGVTQNAAMATSVIVFRTPGRPLRPGSLQITAVRQDNSETITATADADGTISGDAITGFVNTDSGLVQLWFTTDDQDDTGASDVPVYPGSVRYNAVSYAYLPLDADLIGVDPVRLPADGRVPIFRDGDVIVVAHEQISAVGSPAAGAVVALPRAYLAYCLVIDANDVPMDPTEYSVDLDAGEITFNNPVTFVDAQSNALTLPLRAIERVEHMTVVSDAQVSGSLSMISPLPHDFPVDASTVSSALLFGDINARVFAEFTQKSWNNSDPNWTDARDGDDTTASYNLVDSPIVVANNGAISEKWAMVFTGSTNFNIVGETVGIIGTGTINTDTAPLNPNTGNPYFVLLAAGWGTGWTSGNVLRFNSDGCLAPIWMSRTVLSGKGTADDDSVTLQIRGDAD